MRFSEPIWIVAIITGSLVIFILLMMWIIYRRRSRIIKMGRLVTGTVLDIVERRGFKGNKYRMSVVEYPHNQLGKTRVEVLSARRPRTDKKGNEVPLYYHPAKPNVVVLKNDNKTRISIIVLGVLGILVLAAGVFCIRFLLFNTYRY